MLDKSQLRYIRYIRTRAHTIYHTKSVCDIVSFYIHRKFGFDRIQGRFRGRFHFWNVLPDGTILDATADQFQLEPIRIVPIGSAEAKDYERVQVAYYNSGTLKPLTVTFCS